MNNFFFKHLILISLLTILIPVKGFSQIEEFPFQREWATYLKPNKFFLTGEGAEIAAGTNDYLSYQINPYDSLAPYITNPDYNSPYYLLKLESDQTITYVKKFGQPAQMDTLPFYYRGGIMAMDEEDNFYVAGLAQASEGISTEGAYQSNFSENWSDPYEVYYPDLDITITMEPELCKDAFIEKFNPEGEKIWGSYYNGNQDMRSVSLIEQNGYLYLWGLTTSYEGIATPGTYISEWGDSIPHYIYRSFVMKIDKDSGDVLWGTYLDLDTQSGEDSANYIGNRLTVNSNGYCFYFNSDGGLLILDPNGALSSMDSSPVVSYQNVLQMKGDALGNIYITGSTAEIDTIGTPGSFRPTKWYPTQNYILKLNQSGERLWGTYLFNRNLGVPYGQTGFYIAKSAVYIVSFTEEGGLATAGAYQEENAGGQNDLVFMKLEAINGSLHWLSYYGGSEAEGALGTFSPKIGLDSNDNLYIAATSASDPSSIVSENALFQWPIDDKGSFTVKFIHENNLSVDEPEFADLKLYPNPATESIIIKSEVVFRREVKFIIYDILGRKLIHNQGNSEKTQTIDVSTLPAGAYFLNIKSKNINQTFKFIKKQ